MHKNIDKKAQEFSYSIFRGINQRRIKEDDQKKYAIYIYDSLNEESTLLFFMSLQEVCIKRNIAIIFIIKSA